MCVQKEVNQCQMYVYIVFRFYSGKVVIVSITDLELIKKITVKDFANFINHEVSDCITVINSLVYK